MNQKRNKNLIKILTYLSKLFFKRVKESSEQLVLNQSWVQESCLHAESASDFIFVANQFSDLNGKGWKLVTKKKYVQNYLFDQYVIIYGAAKVGKTTLIKSLISQTH